MPFGKLFSIGAFNVLVVVVVGIKIPSQGAAGPVTHRPFGAFNFGRFAAAVAGAADLGSEGRRQLGGVEDGQAFVEDRRFRQCYMVRAGTVAGLAADSRFNEGAFFQIDARGVTPAAILVPGPLCPSRLRDN